MNTILITGARGFFASRFIEYYRDKYNIIALSHSELDITNKNKTIETLYKYAPDFVIHAAALSDTGFCERNPEASFNINVKGSINIASACSSINTKLIYLSSDQVYNGNSEPGPYAETYTAVPDTVYGNHKLEAENRILDITQNVVLLRLTWLFDLPERHKKTNSNIIWNVIKSAMKNEPIKLPSFEYRGITYIYDLLKNFQGIINLPSGIYNTGSENNLSTYETAEAVLNAVGLQYRINGLLIKDLERYKIHNRDLRINNGKLKQHGIEFGSTVEAIENCVKDFGFQFL